LKDNDLRKEEVPEDFSYFNSEKPSKVKTVIDNVKPRKKAKPKKVVIELDLDTSEIKVDGKIYPKKAVKSMGNIFIPLKCIDGIAKYRIEDGAITVERI
jgi:copper chaperone CopZ